MFKGGGRIQTGCVHVEGLEMSEEYIGNKTIASTHDHEAIGRGHGGRAAREEKIFLLLQKWAFLECDMTQKHPEYTKSLSAHQVKCQL